jgi:protein TonB
MVFLAERPIWAWSLVVLLHGAFLAMLWRLLGAEAVPAFEQPLMVNLVMPSIAASPSPPTPAPRPVTVRERSPAPAPVEDPPEERLDSPAEPAVEPRSERRGPETAYTPARYDAEYLDNPPPAYPHLSRRFGEEGRVVLRVLVDAQGRPQAVEVERSSGFARLDRAAVQAVRRWHFVPARRGERTVSEWVMVPIVFSLRG